MSDKDQKISTEETQSESLEKIETEKEEISEETTKNEQKIIQPDDIKPQLKKGRQDPSQGRNWYVVHTYSGYEDAVEKALRQRIESLNMQDTIFDVVVPKEPEIVLKKGEPVQEKKRIFPGYVLVNMIVTDESWYVVRNTPNITGFVGSGNIPVPVSPSEWGIIEKRMESEQAKFKSEFYKGDMVKIIGGPFSSYEGVIDKVDSNKGKARVLISVFDRETPIELDFNQIKKK